MSCFQNAIPKDFFQTLIINFFPYPPHPPFHSVQGAGPEDFSNLPPEQRRKKLQQKVDELNRDIQKEMDQR